MIRSPYYPEGVLGWDKSTAPGRESDHHQLGLPCPLSLSGLVEDPRYQQNQGVTVVHGQRSQ